MPDHYCPHCLTASILLNICALCKRDYHTGPLVTRLSYARRTEISLSLPSVREALPSHLAYVFRDKKRDRSRCGLRYRHLKHPL